ncbi:MAG: PEP-CTERM sorting domain-containing protein [Burkholderiaceae bacterium]|jgi:hypothetical protein|nr:PEP-CTERM sorting domain-containing protein [Burkholderiales bacterium]MCZ8103435.1 PEP-CTERM sorting domain-containing protein [Burkholderiales bacterium]MCZ8336842.1 PEP-CTERM sorting domain-containing protein [Burkholderiaceae bacterium]
MPFVGCRLPHIEIKDIDMITPRSIAPSMRKRCLALLCVGTLAHVPAHAGPVLSYLSGIGVNLTTGMASADRGNTLWLPTAPGVRYQIEDQSTGGKVGPGYGGQPYDLEAMYLQVVGNTLYITGVSGNVDNPATMFPTASGSCASGNCRNFGIGDFFIGQGTNTAFKPYAAIETTGLRFSMDGGGFTTGWNRELAQGRVVQVAGTVGNGSTAPNAIGWETGLNSWGANFKPGAPTQIAATGYTPTAYTATFHWEVSGAHSFYQAVVDLNAFSSAIPGGLTNAFTVHWGEICGNDFLQWDPMRPSADGIPGLSGVTSSQVPVPSSLALLGLGALGFASARRGLGRPTA